jgi:ferric-dicitrate binding protein FerR (iron transport regulator)
MNEHKDPLDSELQDALRDLPAPKPDPAYRERTRKMFLGQTQFETTRFDRAITARAWAWSGGALAAAAAIAVLLFSLPGASTWQVLDTASTGTITVNGVEIPVSQVAGEDLHPGTRIRGSSDGELKLVVPGAVSFVLGPNTEVTVGSSKGFLGSQALSAVVHEGTTWGTTGPDFPAGGFEIETVQADIRITGTTFAVLSDSDTTCVCVLAGTVEVIAKGTGESVLVPPEQQLFVPTGDQPARMAAITSIQRDRLTEIRKLAQSP